MLTTENESHRPGASVIPRAAVFKTAFSLAPCKVLVLANSLLTPKVFQVLASEQQIHDAADKIWAVRCVYRSRDEFDKREGQAEKIAELNQIFMYSYQFRPNSCENYHIANLAIINKMW